MQGLRRRRGTPLSQETPDDPEFGWTESSIVQGLLGRRHSLPVLLSLYRHGSVSTSGLIRELDAHPATVIAVLRDLERLGVLRRFPEVRRRHEIRATLTLRGIGLLETPLYHWGRLIREWGSVP